MANQYAKEAIESLKKQQYSVAANQFRSILALDPENAVMWSNLGTVYFLFVLDNMIPYVGQNWLINVWVYDETNRISKQIQDKAFSILDRQHLSGLRRCLKEAEICFDRAIQYDSKLSTARHWRARLYRDTGRFEDALSEFKVLMSDTDIDIAKSAAKDYKELYDMTWARINNASVPSVLAAQKIEKMFGDELNSLLKPLKEAEVSDESSKTRGMDWSHFLAATVCATFIVSFIFTVPLVGPSFDKQNEEIVFGIFLGSLTGGGFLINLVIGCYYSVKSSISIWEALKKIIVSLIYSWLLLFFLNIPMALVFFTINVYQAVESINVVPLAVIFIVCIFYCMIVIAFFRDKHLGKSFPG